MCRTLRVIVATFVAVAAAGARPVDRYSARWATPASQDAPRGVPAGRPSPPDGPYAGNGDITAMYTGNASSSATASASASTSGATLGWQQWLHLSKNDMWGSDASSYYPHLSAGRVGFLVVPPGAGPAANASVAMFPGNATVVHALTAAVGASVVGATRVLENGVVLTTLVCASAEGGDCAVTLLLSDTDANYYKVAQDAGAAPDGSLVWWRKENLHGALNPAYVGSCDPHLPLQSTERAFTVDAGGSLAMVNGSCLWSDEATSPGIITVGECTAPNGAWTWNGTAAKGDVVHEASAKCLVATGGGGALALGACGSAPWAQLPAGDGNASHVYLSAAGGAGCVVAVPDNNNNTLGVALGVADASGNLVRGTAARVSPADASAGMTFSLSLASGAEYTLVVGLQTLRDQDCAGVRPQWQACATPPEAAAAALVQAMAAPAARAAAVQASDAFWAAYWAASSIDITSAAAPGAAAQLATVERWYYLHQYLLACTTRNGKVTPALDGFVCIEPVAWGDQFTLDYNLEATFWGAGSSNRLDFIRPVMASTTNPGAVATARLRAQNPGTWGHDPNWHSQVGRTVAGAPCYPDGCPNLTTTGFSGTEWPSAGMPLGDGRLADNDLQTRFIGGLLSTNLIQFYEYSGDLGVLAEVIYPFVKDNALFYLSYAVVGADGKLLFPYSCAQEACACRDASFVKVPNVAPLPNFTTACINPDSPFATRCPTASGWELNHPCYECFPYIDTGSSEGYHNAHPDVAFASYTFRNAVRFAKLLGVDGDLASAWQAALDKMPSYPSADFTFVDGALGSEFNGGAGFFVEAEYGYQPGMAPNGSTTTPPVWPWCNKEYPIANFAAMWPTDEIGATQTADQALLARAKQTVFALNKYTARPWANTNGFCLSWPPAVRVSGREDAAALIAAFAAGIASETGENACVQNNGGMLENIGATVAINDMLFQSHGGVLRFFPVWNATALGPASFSTLRAYGAFLVSASVDASGTVSEVSLASEVGGDVVFASPWGGGATPKVTDGSGNAVPVTAVSPGVFSFATNGGASYVINAAAA
jgi:hypothetical protein